VAVAWLMAVAPAELAAGLAGAIAAPAGGVSLVAATLIALRVLVTAGGLMLGRQLAARRPGTRRLALTWAAADLGTLALALASDRLPANRVPGDAPIVWCLYALAAVVVIAASTTAPAGRTAAAAETPN
jgi:hypothetical protein